MYGAILGDIAGSIYTKRPIHTKRFPLLAEDSHFADGTILTAAVACAVMASQTVPTCTLAQLQSLTAAKLQKWGRKFSRVEYEQHFAHWLAQARPRPYDHPDNGAAIRVSAVGWLYGDLTHTLDATRATALATHSDPGSVAGAQAVAAAIFLARTGQRKGDIRGYLESVFGYDLYCDGTFTPANSQGGAHVDPVPQAILAFLNSSSFVDAVRRAVALGSDANTQACIAGGIAEAFYGVPPRLVPVCRERLPQLVLKALDLFYSRCPQKKDIQK